LPSRKQGNGSGEVERAGAPVRSMWSGTITFGLVSIPVDLLSAVRPRQTAMRLVDKSGHPLGREYRCSKEGKKLAYDELVRGFETDEGKMVVITDEEFEAAAPEMSGDIELRHFVPLEQIPPMYFQKPYFLTPSGKSAKAYALLATTMERTGRVAIGNFVMRGHEYLVAIVSDNGVLRADTLRYEDELRTPESIGLPKRGKVTASKVTAFAKQIAELTRKELDTSELGDQDAGALMQLAQKKVKDDEDVVRAASAEAADDEAAEGGKVIDLMEVLRKSLSKRAMVTTADSGPPISLDERRAQRAAAGGPTKKKATSKRRAGAKGKTPRKRASRS
jgi:DNA end-binding protein Ku